MKPEQKCGEHFPMENNTKRCASEKMLEKLTPYSAFEKLPVAFLVRVVDFTAPTKGSVAVHPKHQLLWRTSLAAISKASAEAKSTQLVIGQWLRPCSTATVYGFAKDEVAQYLWPTANGDL